MTLRIVHLIDDASAGGVNRMIEHLTCNARLSLDVSHHVVELKRGRWSTPRFSADLIVSHMSVSWRNMPMLTALRAIHPGTPLLHVEHSYCEGFVVWNDVPRRRFSALLRATYALFDKVIAVSKEQADWMLRNDFLSARKLQVIRPVVDLDPFLEIATPVSTPVRRAGMIGRLHRQKGFDIALRAFVENTTQDIELHIYGDGPERGQLEAIAQGDSRVLFHGFANDPVAAIAACDIVVMPSRWEPFGLVALEAMAAGRPVLCASVDGLRDQIEMGALPVEGSSVRAWASVFAQLETESLALRAMRSRHSAQHARDRFAEQWSEEIADLCGLGWIFPKIEASDELARERETMVH